MLLELFASTIEGRDVAASTLVASTPVADTNAYRRLVRLEQAGMVETMQDNADGRRTFIRLAEPTFHRLVIAVRASMIETRRHLFP